MSNLQNKSMRKLMFTQCKKLLKDVPYDWKSLRSDSESIYIIDQQSLAKITEAIDSNQYCQLEDINHSLVQQYPIDQTKTVYLEPLLKQGLNENAQNQGMKFTVISKELNEYIFMKLGFRGVSIKRQIIEVDGVKQIELYPKLVECQLISVEELNKTPVEVTKQGVRSFKFAQKQKCKISYSASQTAKDFRLRLQNLLKERKPEIDGEIKIYLYNPSLFRRVKYQRMLQYYFWKEDIQNAAVPQQSKFYQIINQRRFDQFAVQFFPGKLLRKQPLKDLLKQNSKIIVQCYSEDKWVFPEQPVVSVAKKCRFCDMIGQLYMQFNCGLCRAKLLYCSRVCHYQDLLTHPCKSARQTLDILYDKQPFVAQESSIDRISAIDSLMSNNVKGSSSKEALGVSMNGSSALGEPPKNKIVSADVGSVKKDNLKKNSSQVSSVVPANRTKSSVKSWGGGIQNYGNICYMSSALQVISRTALERLLFKVNYFTRGQPVADRYVKLLKLMEKSSDLTPIKWDKIQEFRNQLGDKMPQFANYSQHDSHEFLIQFIDTLHMELNKNEGKKQFQVNQIQGDNEIVQSRKQWLNFIMGNNSPITELFYGQLKEMTQCPHCHYKKINFPLFNNLSCSIPAIYQPVRLPFYYETHHYRQKTKLVHISCIGTVKDVLDKFRGKVKIPDEIKHNIKLFSVGYEGEAKQFSLEARAVQLFEGKKKNDKQNQLFIFQSLYSVPSVLIVRFNDFRGAAMSVKRPLFFKQHATDITCRAIYDMVFNYLISMVTKYLNNASQSDKIASQLKTNIVGVFTLTMYTGGKEGDNGKMVFVGPGKQLSYKDDKMIGQSTEGVEIWVTLTDQRANVASSSLYIFNECVTKKISIFSRDQDRYGLSIDTTNDQVVSLEECLKQEYNRSTILDRDNLWYCPTCQAKRRAHRNTSIYKAGRYIIVQIKRFKFNQSGSECQKNQTKVLPPLQLNLKKLLVNSTLPETYYLGLKESEKKALHIEQTSIDSSETHSFKLRGLILHQGQLGNGHYKAIVWQNQQWIEFDDSNSNVVNIETFLNKSQNLERIYVLLYKRAPRS